MPDKQAGNKKMKILDVGCGSNKLKSEGNDVIGIDFDKRLKPDVVWNLNNLPYPFRDSEFDEITSTHCIEHLDYSSKDPDDVLKELWRIAKHNGLIKIKVPHFSSTAAWGHWQHKRPFAAFASILHINDKLKDYFKIEKMELHYATTYSTDSKKNLSKIINFFANMNLWFCERIWLYYVGGFQEVEMWLKVRKSDETDICEVNKKAWNYHNGCPKRWTCKKINSEQCNKTYAEMKNRA